MRRPLEDVTILAVEQYGAGPWGTVHLADLGARIIKIEDPTSKGDIGRYVPPFQEGEDSLFFETFCHNKESISLQLRSPEGRATFERLVPHADAVFSNLRGDGPAKLKILYDDLKHLNPAIVCASLTGFGMTGPRAAEGGYDYIAQGMAGWMSLTGDPDGPPTKSGLSLVDMSTGYAAALAMMCALWRARRDGEGCDVDVSLFETAFNLDMYVSTWHLSRGWEPIRTRNSSSLAIRAIASTIARSSAASSPSTSWRTNVAMPVAEYASTGSPAVRASSAAMPNASICAGAMNASEAARVARTCSGVRRPARSTTQRPWSSP